MISSIYDDHFLVKSAKSTKAMMPHADMELPYEGAKEMQLDNRDFPAELLTAMYDELPAPRPEKK